MPEIIGRADPIISHLFMLATHKADITRLTKPPLNATVRWHKPGKGPNTIVTYDNGRPPETAYFATFGDACDYAAAG